MNRHHVETEVEVLAESPGGDFVGEVAIGGRDHPHVDGDRLVVADPHDHPFLQRAKDFGLRRQREVADLIEEERATICRLESPRLIGDRARERPFDVAEELTLHQFAGNRGTVHFDERAVLPDRGLVDGARHQLLAAAVLAGDEDPGVGRSDASHQLADLRQRGAVTNHGEARVGDLGEALAQPGVLAREAPVIERALDRHQEAIGIERLLEEVKGPVLHRLHGRGDRAVAGDHHHTHVRILLLQLLQRLDAIDPLHLDVEQDQVERTEPEGRQRLAPRTGGGNLIPLVAEHLRQDVANRALVVDHQDPPLHRRPPLR